MAVDWGQIDTAKANAQSAAEQANAFTSKGYTLADELRKAVGERFAESPIAKQSAQARTDYLSSAPQARSEVSDLIKGGAIMSPTQIQSILSAKKSAALMPVLGANINQEAAFGSLEDLVNAGVNAWKAQTSYQQGLADIAQNSYSSLLNELLKKSEEERQSELFPIQKEQALANLLKTQTGTAQSTIGSEDVESWALNIITKDKDGNIGIDQNLLNSVPDKLKTEVLKRAGGIMEKMIKDNEADALKAEQQKQQNSWWNKTTSAINPTLSWMGNGLNNLLGQAGNTIMKPVNAYTSWLENLPSAPWVKK